MYEQIMQTITEYGLETVIIALAINLMTGLIKIPIKKLAGRLKESTRVTRFIVFLPVLLGFGFTVLYRHVWGGGFAFDRGVITQWVASSSLSLTFYAIFEKLFPGKKAALTESEIAANRDVLERISEMADGEEAEGEIQAEQNERAETVIAADSQANDPAAVQKKRIILKGRADHETEIEK